MGNVTESVFDGENVTIPLAEVSHIEKYKGCICIVFKHSKWNEETQNMEPSIFPKNEEAIKFKKAWCRYRYELEKEDLKELV